MSKLHRRRRLHLCGLLVMVAGVLGVVAASQALLAQAPAEAGGQALPRFRRVFAPADQFQAWPFQNERYLPLPGAEFEDLVRRAEAGQFGSSILPLHGEV